MGPVKIYKIFKKEKDPKAFFVNTAILRVGPQQSTILISTAFDKVFWFPGTYPWHRTSDRAPSLSLLIGPVKVYNILSS